MLVMNGHRESSIPIGHFGGILYSDIQPNWFRPWSWHNIYIGDGGFPKQTSIPDGNYHPVSWFWPMTQGNMTSRHRMIGSGTISASGNLGYQILADLTGSGGISNALGTLIINLVASISGSGEISAADPKAFLFALADLSGSGGVSDADLEGFGALASALSGSCTVVSTLTGVGELSSDIKSYGDLTAENVRDAVWNAILANYLSSGSTGQALNAAGSAGDPWITELPGSYTGNQAGMLLSIIQKILRNKVVTDPVAGTYSVYDDDNNVLLSGNLWEDADGTVPYQGSGAERRDRLT